MTSKGLFRANPEASGTNLVHLPDDKNPGTITAWDLEQTAVAGKIKWTKFNFKDKNGETVSVELDVPISDVVTLEAEMQKALEQHVIYPIIAVTLAGGNVDAHYEGAAEPVSLEYDDEDEETVAWMTL